jgi:hypothetical protein
MIMAGDVRRKEHLKCRGKWESYLNPPNSSSCVAGDLETCDGNYLQCDMQRQSIIRNGESENGLKHRMDQHREASNSEPARIEHATYIDATRMKMCTS